MIVVLVPVLGRPHRVAPLLANLAASTGEDVKPFFIASPGDTTEIAAIDATTALRVVAPWAVGPGDYARKINLGARLSVSYLPAVRYLFLAADDVYFHDGWAEKALEVARATGALVVGTNDLGNPGTVHGIYSTHPLVHLTYMDWGVLGLPGRRQLYHEGYSHNGCDAEFCATARHRLVYEHARGAVVEHLHHAYGKAPDDDTYRAGRADVERDDWLVSERCAQFGVVRA